MSNNVKEEAKTTVSAEKTSEVKKINHNLSGKTDIRLKNLIMCVIGCLLSGTNICGFNPVGMGYFAALNINKGSAVISVLAFLLGMTRGFYGITIFKNAAILISAIIIMRLLSIGKLRLSENVAAVITGIVMLIMETADYIMTHSMHHPDRVVVINIMIIAAISVMSGLMCIIFKKAVNAVIMNRHVFENDEMFGFAVIAGISVYNLGENFNIPAAGVEILVFFMILYVAYKYGIGPGALMGLACAIPVSIWNEELNYLGMICMMGITIGLFRELGRLASATTMLMIGFVSFYAIYPSTMTQAAAAGDIMKGILGAVAVFLMLPKSMIYRYEENKSRDDNDSVKMMFEERLLNVAKTFEQLSKSLFSEQENGVVYELSNGQLSELVNKNSPDNANENFNVTENEKSDVHVETTSDRMNREALKEGNLSNEIWKNRLKESRSIMSEQLEQISKIIEDYSKQVYNFVRVTNEQEDYIRHKLKSKKVYMDKIVGLENSRNRKEYLVTAKCGRGATVGSREIAEVISEAFGKNYIPSKNCRKLISTEFTTTTYVEETNFYVVHAAAKKARGGNGISGDNYSLRELENGHLLMGLSDGMGYGTSACLESETVIELLEQFLDSGFDADCALKMINSVMVMNSDEDHPATLDYGVIDLHSGMCDMVKIGAAATFVKRGNWVETIKSTSMPLGIFANVDYDSTSKKLYNGDMIIMVSDGVIDAMNCENKDEKLGEIISSIEYNNPKEMAEAILNRAVADKTKLSDDMTVLVTEIWENARAA